MACDKLLMELNRLKASRRGIVLLAFILGFLSAVGAEYSPHLNWTKHFVGLGYERIDLRRSAENHLYLLSQLDGRRRSVLVDTGWSLTTVSTNAALELLSLRDSATNENPRVLIKRLKLGRTSFLNQPALVQNMVYDGQVTPFEVVLGCDFLRRHFAVIDCRSHRLYVRSKALTEQEQINLEAGLGGGGFRAVSLKLKTPLAMTCPARVNGKPVEMLVDTGAVWSTLDVRQINRLGLRALPTLAKISGVGKSGTRGVAMAEVNSFVLGEIKMKDTSFALMDLGDWGMAVPGKELGEVEGILGGAELVANGALIDCHALKLWVKRGGPKN